MNVNLNEIIPSYCVLEELNYFNQFNVYETIYYKDNREVNTCNNNLHENVSTCNNNIKLYQVKYCNNQNLEIKKIDYTCPKLSIMSAKIINTMEGTSLEGQHLTGKKLVIVGKVELCVILTHNSCNNKESKCIKDVSIPFSTFIIIPNDICNVDIINLRYLIEDTTIEDLLDGKLLASVTILIQYAEEC